MLNYFYVIFFVILELVWICWNDTKEHELKKSKEVDTETGTLEAMAPAMAKYRDGKFYPCLAMGKSGKFSLSKI